MRFILVLLLLMLGGVRPAHASPNAQPQGQAIGIPFEPPLGEALQYRVETTDQRNGQMRMSWSIDSYRFDDAEDGYRLTVQPLSNGSNEQNPLVLGVFKELESLMQQPFVLRLNANAEIVGVEREEEYWTKITDALRGVLSKMEPKGEAQSKVVEAVLGLYTGMSPEARRAKLTESVQSLLDFGGAELSIGKAVLAKVDTESPLGPVKREVAITLTKLDGGFAHLALRSTIPAAEMKKLTSAFFDRLNNGAMKAKDLAKAKATIAAAEEFRSETVADYTVSMDDGMLETFKSTQTISMSDGKKLERRVKTMSVNRVY